MMLLRSDYVGGKRLRALCRRSWRGWHRSCGAGLKLLRHARSVPRPLSVLRECQRTQLQGVLVHSNGIRLDFNAPDLAEAYSLQAGLNNYRSKVPLKPDVHMKVN